ncbi:S8 family serine peptidase [Streptomyces sp. NPDC093252]|uniref:S8 family serine peptidase n=1 Tax=Streptomyces sp. NPDC093252 TaxID=3154980 RepID=UPI003420C742
MSSSGIPGSRSSSRSGPRPTGSHPRPGGRSRAAAVTLATALLCGTAGVAPGAAAAAPRAETPVPLPSAGASAAPAPKLPVMPPYYDLTQNPCTEGSDRTVTAVPWAQQKLELTRAHQLSTGAGVTVAVIDTGVASGVAALKGRVSGAGTGATEDCVGHGTFVASVIAARPAAGSGFSGVAPDARILAVRAIDSTGAPDPARVAQGIRSAVDAGAEVISVSLAFTSASDALKSALDHAADEDVLVVAAGVPDGVTDQSPAEERRPVAFWPAAQPGVLSVVDLDINDARTDGAFEPVRADLAAPGQGITGIGPRGKGNYLANGASVAAAFTAGAAALVRSYEPELTAGEVADRLVAGGYPAQVPRLNPYGALSAVLPTDAPPLRAGASDIRLNPVYEDPAPARRAYTVLTVSLTAAAVLGGAVLLARRHRRGRA